MAFQPASSKISFPEMEERMLRFWNEQGVFEKSVRARADAPKFTFYEGPPTANGRPGVHHVLARAYKDVIPRYKTMRGYSVPRKAGWDTHGLPVEIEVEKDLGLNSKREIEAFGIREFNERCKASVFRYEADWRKLSERIGFWLDYSDPYVTFHDGYIESVWWILRQMWDKGLMYKGYKVVPYCPRCGTPLSSHEVALGYDKTNDPSVYVKMRLVDDPRTSLLVWTTTPWTLPANVACAIAPDVTYVRVKQGEEELILAAALAEQVLQGPYEITAEMKGSALVGLRYEPLFPFFVPQDRAWSVIAADFVTTEDGTGIVHLAPAYGEDDMEMSRRHGLPVLHPVGPDGRYTSDVRPWEGVFVKDADPRIIDDLRARGLLYKAGTYEHTYPFCWRCDTPLLYYARSSFHVAMTAMRDDLLAANQTVNWVPEHIRDGRFGNWLQKVNDWALSRERYWGTPLPVWTCEDCDHLHCVGSIAELRSMAKSMPAHFELHRPYVDEVVVACPKCAGDMRRVKDLIDVWFDSGAMPVAQWHHPFENQDVFARSFPADYICEGIDQTRGWFYSLMAISTVLFGVSSYRTCVCLELVLDEEGQKMSKSRGNVIDPWTLIERSGADALRWYFFAVSPPGTPKRLGPSAVDDVVRRFFLTLWNTHVFFTTYAALDRFDPRSPAPDRAQRPALDRWLLSRLHGVVRDTTANLDAYDPTTAARDIERLVEDLSTWYVRRGRRRYWKTQDDADKQSAYHTLYEALVTVAKLIAPFAPFLGEALYQDLVRAVDDRAPESVHLCDWPAADEAGIDRPLEDAMEEAQRVVGLGRAARARSKRKVRQPLPAALIVSHASRLTDRPELLAHVAEELNVKTVRFVERATDYVTYEIKPRFDRLGPKLGAKVRELATVLSAFSAEETARVVADGHLNVSVNGEAVALALGDLDVRAREREGFVAEAGHGDVVVLDAHVDAALAREGLARELVHHVQQARRDAGFSVDQRIELVIDAGGEVAEAVREHEAFLADETLAVEVRRGAPEEGRQREIRVDGHRVVLGLAPRTV
ncbi:MAG: isoleucine--tRNA ligase [Armatimonadetes bacterium]|nr:isoleucine--tRNA ligase [Armatimonadota bacterium]